MASASCRLGLPGLIFRKACSSTVTSPSCSHRWSHRLSSGVSGPAQHPDRGKEAPALLWGSPGYGLPRGEGKAYFSSTSVISNKEKTAGADDDDLDKPIKFTTSKAAKFTAKESLSGDPMPDTPDWQPYVVIVSTAAFLIYFLYLREENDIDLEMEKPLWQKVPSLERQQLEIVLDYNRHHGLPTEDVEKRLQEIYREQALVKAQAAANK